MLIVDSEREIERERESFHAVGTTNLEEKCFCLIGGCGLVKKSASSLVPFKYWMFY